MLNVERYHIQDVRNYILRNVKEAIEKENLNPTLVIFQTNEVDEASNIYIRNKIKTCEAVGIKVELINATFFTLNEFKKCIRKKAYDSLVDGIIIQLPLNNNFENHKHELLDIIPWWKDVDGLTSDSVGRLWTGQRCLKSATASGVCKLLDTDFPNGLHDIKVSIINRSDLIGKPLIKMLLDRNATVEVLHSKSNIYNIENAFKDSQILVTGIGNDIYAKLFNEDGAIWIDCGIVRSEDGHITGDSGTLKSDRITPTPYGMGTLTTACLCENVCLTSIWKKHNSI